MRRTGRPGWQARRPALPRALETTDNGAGWERCGQLGSFRRPCDSSMSESASIEQSILVSGAPREKTTGSVGDAARQPQAPNAEPITHAVCGNYAFRPEAGAKRSVCLPRHVGHRISTPRARPIGGLTTDLSAGSSTTSAERGWRSARGAVPNSRPPADFRAPARPPRPPAVCRQAGTIRGEVQDSRWRQYLVWAGRSQTSGKWGISAKTRSRPLISIREYSQEGRLPRLTCETPTVAGDSQSGVRRCCVSLNPSTLSKRASFAPPGGLASGASRVR